MFIELTDRKEEKVFIENRFRSSVIERKLEIRFDVKCIKFIEQEQFSFQTEVFTKEGDQVYTQELGEAIKFYEEEIKKLIKTYTKNKEPNLFIQAYYTSDQNKLFLIEKHVLHRKS